MQNFLSHIIFPFAVTAFVVGESLVFSPTDRPGEGKDVSVSATADTVIYDMYGYRKGWDENEKAGAVDIPDSLLSLTDSSFFFANELEDSLAASDSGSVVRLRPIALDTLVAPEYLMATDSFRFKYYAALKDSASHMYIRDSLIEVGDLEDWPKLDSLYTADSLALQKALFEEWYLSLDPKARKEYDKEQRVQAKLARIDSVTAVRDSLKAQKDSIAKATPRILETYFLPDSLYYKRIVTWTHTRDVHKINVQDSTADYEYHFNDYPFQRKDVNATWLGVAGSPVQYYNFFNRTSEEGVSFYDAQEPWSVNPSTMLFYNTKTPYTELGYSGTLFKSSDKASDNVHILTTQNLTSNFNFTFLYDRFGGDGMLDRETTRNKNLGFNANYIGKKYLMHFGYIYNMVGREENGGVVDNYFIRDTTLDAREVEINLENASSKIKKNTVFLDQQYRIPFKFLDRKADGAVDDSLDLRNITTAFIGHSTEYSTYSRTYNDEITDDKEKEYFNNVFNYNPSKSMDSLHVRKLENRLFLRLQPWAEGGVVSKLDVGVGNRIWAYYSMSPSLLYENKHVTWSSNYVYGGVEGQLRSYIHWDASANYVFSGDEQNDLAVQGNVVFSFKPFRKAKESPVSILAHAETTLDEPDYYQKHFYSNHFSWDNEFKKVSTTKLRGEISVPRWKFDLSASYALLDNNLYYDCDGIVRQNTSPMSVFSATLDKDLVLAKLLHLDHRVLFQLSSNEDVVPLPMVSVNAKYYIQFSVVRDVMDMQIGVNTFYFTKWNLPSWNPVTGTYYNQKDFTYGDAPYFDAFVNIQWKRASIFLKVENIGMGWPLDYADYFSANHYIRTQRTFKIGINWPFYNLPDTGKNHSHSSSNSNGSGSSVQKAR